MLSREHAPRLASPSLTVIDGLASSSVHETHTDASLHLLIVFGSEHFARRFRTCVSDGFVAHFQNKMFPPQSELKLSHHFDSC